MRDGSAAAQFTRSLSEDVAGNSFGKVIAVGDVDEWKSQGHSFPGGAGVRFLSFSDLHEGTLALHRPDVIYSPVLARDFDCIELASLLHNIGFTGIYRAVGNDLPKPQVIEREVREMSRRLTFEIVKL